MLTGEAMCGPMLERVCKFLGLPIAKSRDGTLIVSGGGGGSMVRR